jgi:DNA repair protein RadC
MSIHEGHRQHMKERFLREGLDNFTEVQVLELLLFYVIPRKDTNPIAHRLIDRFGSLSQVLEAPVEELEKVDGIGPNAAMLLSLITAVARVYMVNRTEKQKILNSIEECGRYLKSFFIGRRVEMVYLLCLDAKCKVLSCREVGEGSVNSANVPIRRIVELALSQNASSVVLAHNHPSGVAIPSAEDVSTTRRVAAALSTVDIPLVDHIIVADDDFVSLVQSGYRFDDCVII